MSRSITIVLIFANAIVTNVRADVTTTFGYSQWQSMVGSFSTIDFTEYPSGTPISNQYVDQGVYIASVAFISGPTPGYANDGWGLHGPTDIHVFFDNPQLWIAIHHAGTAFFKLYSKGELIGTSGFDPIGGIGSFLGAVSTVHFDEVIITTQPIYGPHIFVDDLHWGAPIPAPGTLGLLLVIGFSMRRRHR